MSSDNFLGLRVLAPNCTLTPAEVTLWSSWPVPWTWRHSFSCTPTRLQSLTVYMSHFNFPRGGDDAAGLRVDGSDLQRTTFGCDLHHGALQLLDAHCLQTENILSQRIHSPVFRLLLPPNVCAMDQRPYAVAMGADVHVAMDCAHTCDVPSVGAHLNPMTLRHKEQRLDCEWTGFFRNQTKRFCVCTMRKGGKLGES